MVAKKPRIVIIGAGMAGLTAANKLYTAFGFKDSFELAVVEGGSRIGGRINTSEFGGDRVELGATWIHGIGGSPVHKIAQEIRALESEQPWECMDGSSEDPARFTTVAEGGFELDRPAVEPVSTLFKTLMDYAQGKLVEEDGDSYYQIAEKAYKACTDVNGGVGIVSVGSYLRQGLEFYWAFKERGEEGLKGYGNWTRKLLEDGVFRAYENTQRTYTSADDLLTLDYAAESEYRMCSEEEITIAKGYLSIIESLASVLPPGLVQLGRKVRQIEWQPETRVGKSDMGNGYGGSTSSRPVQLHFCDGSTMVADHVIVTVSLGVLKAGVHEDSGMFNPPLPSFKTQAISRLGFGVVNKLFLQLSPTHDRKGQDFHNFPFLQMVFHRGDSQLRHEKVPWWMRKTASMFPIYENSNVLLSWFAGKEALELESLKDEQIISGVSTTISSFLSKPSYHKGNPSSHEVLTNGNVSSEDKFGVKVTKVLRTHWGNDPLFMGSYSYVAVGSSGEDLDRMAEPLPRITSQGSSVSPPLQLLFAGEATHRTHYSTTHGAYFSGLREANRLLQHYHCVGV
ncbi:FAD/NAD(P)-binding domain containing protein [Parasponia andersonii]|uniref:FAD/NAD(P)-binding domain containing protein n=1 Tax=Parasponia andersonii TaxID=3476 RepID=A0A2P5BNU8_PARAD|nr:FAD/NAD(P)-binding domain containing protein [Parasponia andersonii]